MQIARPGVRVARAPAGEQHFAHIGHVVAVGVLEEQRLRRFLHDHAAVAKADAGGNAELVGKDGELVGPAVAVGVFAECGCGRGPWPSGCDSLG